MDQGRLRLYAFGHLPIGCQAGSRRRRACSPIAISLLRAGLAGWDRVPRPCAAAPTCHLVRGKCHADTMQLELDRSPPARRPRRFACAVPPGSQKRTCASAPRHRHAPPTDRVRWAPPPLRPADIRKQGPMTNRSCQTMHASCVRCPCACTAPRFIYTRARVASRTVHTRAHHTHISTNRQHGARTTRPEWQGRPTAVPALPCCFSLCFFDFADRPTTQMSSLRYCCPPKILHRS